MHHMQFVREGNGKKQIKETGYQTLTIIVS